MPVEKLHTILTFVDIVKLSVGIYSSVDTVQICLFVCCIRTLFTCVHVFAYFASIHVFNSIFTTVNIA